MKQRRSTSMLRTCMMGAKGDNRAIVSYGISPVAASQMLAEYIAKREPRFYLRMIASGLDSAMDNDRDGALSVQWLQVRDRLTRIFADPPVNTVSAAQRGH
jgi:hypothetical protein